MAKKHPGFKAVQAKIAAKEGVSKKSAGAILASASRNASPAAKRKNPALKKVHGFGASHGDKKCFGSC
jgi:hypothetical protein